MQMGSTKIYVIRMNASFPFPTGFKLQEVGILHQAEACGACGRAKPTWRHGFLFVFFHVFFPLYLN